jgi:hypothetical protein
VDAVMVTSWRERSLLSTRDNCASRGFFYIAGTTGMGMYFWGIRRHGLELHLPAAAWE